MPYRFVPARRRRGLGDTPSIFSFINSTTSNLLGGTTVNPYNGDILNSDGSIAGSCTTFLGWISNSACLANSMSQWAAMAQLKSLGNNYVPPAAPSTDADSAALTCPDPTIALADCGDLIAEQASALIQSLTNASVKATQAANLAASQSQGPIGDDSGGSGCDPTEDAFSCLGGLSWYWWAAIVAGGLAIVLAVKK